MTMYSPKIDKALVPVLYQIAKVRSAPMTRLVDRLLYSALAMEPMPFEAYARFQPQRMLGTPLLTAPRSGTLEELTQVFQDKPAFAFRDKREVEAWYAATVHGFCRALELALEKSGEDVSRDAPNVEFFRQATYLRNASLQFLTPRETAVAGAEIVPFGAPNESSKTH